MPDGRDSQFDSFPQKSNMAATEECYLQKNFRIVV